MIDLIVCLLLLLGISACVAEVYFVVAYMHSRFGEFPPFFPSFGKMKKVCLEEAEQILRQSQKTLTIVDLGCGSGSLLIPLAKKFPQHRFIGYDWDVVPYAIASFRARHIVNVELFCADFTQADLSEADIVLIFGGKKLFAQWGKKFVESLKNDAVIVSEAFPITQLVPEKEILATSYGMALKVYTYRIAKKTLAKSKENL